MYWTTKQLKGSSQAFIISRIPVGASATQEKWRPAPVTVTQEYQQQQQQQEKDEHSPLASQQTLTGYPRPSWATSLKAYIF
ncbi:hypothetical protein BG015_008204 [Linnemannia schmuckeri]|uniref:Uncharacterized protein n=1 Tax=Linnemannia schmuckeri TaxID=64567 RepID=A0A9P5RXU9_9FUNG|nr:hypothetical protein BG015_008204 [Linnemannia schmuckeri]